MNKSHSRHKKTLTSSLFLPFLIIVSIALPSCSSLSHTIHPQVDCAIQDHYLKTLPSPFPPLSKEERSEPWGEEYFIGMQFAKSLDLYRSITAFKRSEFLIPHSKPTCRLETSYHTLLSYYLGGRYASVIETFERSPLQRADKNFVAYQDLLLILYDTFLQERQMHRADHISQLIEEGYPLTAEKLDLSLALRTADLTQLKESIPKLEADMGQELYSFLHHYTSQKKSVFGAQFFQALLPGSGYLYLGQKQSALTSLLLNGLFAGATYHFFHKDHIAAGIITASFEMGWYFGGIYGAGQGAKLYNERLYEAHVRPLMRQKKLSPALMLQYGF